MTKIVYKKDLSEGQFITFNDYPLDFEFIEVEQVHSNIILNSNEVNSPADGIIHNENSKNKFNFAIKTADCLPVLIIGKFGHSLIHAGWRGVYEKIFLNTILETIEPYYFFIGPHISAKNYEVQKDFTVNFKDSSNIYNSEGKLFFNLSGEAQNQILSKYQNAIIETCNLCTFDHDDLNSYRKDKTQKRNYNLFIPNK